MVSSATMIDLRPSAKEQIELGKKAAEQIRKENKVLPATDPRVIYLRKMGEVLLKQIPEAERKRRPFQYSFDVIDSKEINAFALPGGPIFFFTGLIDTMTTEDQLLGVLGHEIVHVRNQHWASQYADTMKRQLGLTVLLELIGANGTLYDIAAIVDAGAFQLPYSRRHESESDRVGYDMLLSAGFNPVGMADVFDVFAGGRKEDGFGEMLSTHPDPANRAKAIRTRLTKEKKVLPAQRPLPFETKAIRDKKNAKPTERLPKQAQASCWCGSGH